MGQTVKPVPEGMHTVIPHLILSDAAAAIAFYVKAFGAVEEHRMLVPGETRVMHASVRIGDSRVFLCDEFPEHGAKSPRTLGGTPVKIHLSVEDADALAARAVEAGATVDLPVTEMFWGDRYGILTDPFGHVWSVSTHVVDLTPEQVAERMAQAMPAS